MTNDVIPIADARVRSYSENAAAEKLNIHRSTLALWRRKGLLNPEMLLPGKRAFGPPNSRTRPMAYNAEFVDQIMTGERAEDEMFAENDGIDPDAA